MLDVWQNPPLGAFISIRLSDMQQSSLACDHLSSEQTTLVYRDHEALGAMDVPNQFFAGLVSTEKVLCLGRT